MGTRSRTKVFDGNFLVATIYRQHDGYPEGHGCDLVQFLDGRRLVNGIKSSDSGTKFSNGMGCLAASLIAELKTEPGGIYMVAPCEEQEEYEYDVHQQGEGLFLRVRHWGKEVFQGWFAQFQEFCANPPEEE